MEAKANGTEAVKMAAYMKNQFPFLGLKSPVRRAAQKPLLEATKASTESELLSLAHLLFAEPEREFAYTACDLLRKHSRKLTAPALLDLRKFVQTESWWDTVDALATHPVGDLVRANSELSEDMDQWIHDEDMWVARTAILHQLMWKSDTDSERLFHYCDLRAEDKEFFIRKALGWALRQHARTEPEEVRAYVRANEDRLSGLTKREALKHIGP